MSRYSSIGIAAISALLVCSCPPQGHAQQLVYAANTYSGLDSVSQAAINREFMRARERGIPVEPLMAKVREGRLKSAPGQRIHIAVVALSARLDSAHSALGIGSTTDEMVAGADALLFGAPPSSLRAVRAATTRPIAAPLGTLAQLVASGVAPKRATDMVVGLLRRNAAPAQVLALGNLVESDVRSGLRAEESATFRLRSIESSLGDAFTASTVVPTAPAVPTGVAPTTGKPVRKP